MPPYAMPVQVRPMVRFDLTAADIGRHVRRISTGDIGIVKRDPGNGWLFPSCCYEWRGYRGDLEYVRVCPADETSNVTPLPVKPPRSEMRELLREFVEIDDASAGVCNLDDLEALLKRRDVAKARARVLLDGGC